MTSQINATIPNGTAITNAIDLGGKKLAGIIMPAAWTTADLTFQASWGGQSAYNNVHNDAGDEYVIPAGASRAIVFNVPLPFASIKIRSGTDGSPVNQDADRSLVLNLDL